jgi:DNA repair exonuclease SbcCD ATPase subunit
MATPSIAMQGVIIGDWQSVLDQFTRMHEIVEDLQAQIGRDTIPALVPFITPGESIATNLGKVFYNSADVAEKLVRFETNIENRLTQQQDILKSVQETLIPAIVAEVNIAQNKADVLEKVITQDKTILLTEGQTLVTELQAYKDWMSKADTALFELTKASDEVKTKCTRYEEVFNQAEVAVRRMQGQLNDTTSQGGSVGKTSSPFKRGLMEQKQIMGLPKLTSDKKDYYIWLEKFKNVLSNWHSNATLLTDW